MEFKNLEGLSERTLKFMIVDLSKKNSCIEENLTDSFKAQYDRLHKEYLIMKTKLEVMETDMISKQTEYSPNDKNIIEKWLEQCCENADNVLAEDGKTLRAPTSFRLLYDNFSEWCCDILCFQSNQIPDMHIVKKELKKWQEKSQYGLNYGKRKDKEGVNGYEAHMLFNLKIL